MCCTSTDAAGVEDSKQQVFEANLREIHRHNADETQTWTAGVNQFTDLTADQLSSQHKGLKLHVSLCFNRACTAPVDLRCTHSIRMQVALDSHAVCIRFACSLHSIRMRFALDTCGLHSISMQFAVEYRVGGIMRFACESRDNLAVVWLFSCKRTVVGLRLLF